MCGIIGIASSKPVSTNIINSLKRLEYRGYDSAGLATLTKSEINEKKCSGRVEELEKILFKTPSNGNIGIGHVRWATHGVPNILNAHPHSSDIVSVVHDGIIENADEIKKNLEEIGYKFKSQTDTEVITLLLTEELKINEPLESVFKTLKKLKGSFALGIIFKNYKDIIIGARRGSPLAVGYSNEENYLGSDSYALQSMTNKISYLDDGDLCVLSKDTVEFYDENKNKINKEINILSNDEDLREKGDYKNFMSKEIFEQPITIQACINKYTDSLKNASTKVSSLAGDYAKASESLAVLNEAASSGADTGAEMQKMASTLEQLNESYASQLNGSQQQAETMQSMYAGITELMTNLSDSVEDTKKYKENISELSTNLSALNNVYGNMLTAMKS